MPILIAKNDIRVNINVNICKYFLTIQNCLDDCEDGNETSEIEIPVMNISAWAIQYIANFITDLKDIYPTEWNEEIQNNFIKESDVSDVLIEYINKTSEATKYLEICLAADYLNVPFVYFVFIRIISNVIYNLNFENNLVIKTLNIPKHLLTHNNKSKLGLNTCD